MEQAMRKNKAVASYCLGGLLSLIFLVQIITGGFSFLEFPLTGCKLKQAQLPIRLVMPLEVDGIRRDARFIRENTSEEKVYYVALPNVTKQAYKKSSTDITDSSYHQCIQRSKDHKRATEATNGYLLTFANGGLNQMRAAICDMVAITRLMNATMVIPDLDHNSYWDDPSDFGDIFDVDRFIQTLKDDIKIVKVLPSHFKSLKVFELAPKSWSEARYYQEDILPLLRKHKVVRFTLTDSRLANNRLPDEIQQLRCRANYKALRFQSSLRSLGRKIIKKLRDKGTYIALHLRYEKDMLAFSGCTAGLSSDEADDLKRIRYSTNRWKEKEINAVSKRASGGCPLMPLEIGLLLKAMGYPGNTSVYIAAGQIYGGEKRMESFTRFFPNVFTKETVGIFEDIQPFLKYQNRLAAVDYMVALESQLFVPTYDGNMARVVEGHRRFQGHKKTLTPNRAELVKIFDAFQRDEIGWEVVQSEVQSRHKKRSGHPHYRKAFSPSQSKFEENFYANPFPGCICHSQSV